MLPHSARAEFVLRGFEASYHFLQEFSTTAEVTPVYLLPAVHPFSAICSWMFVLKILYSRYQVYINISETEKTLMDIQKIMASSSKSRGDFCWRAGIYMDHLLQDAKANEQTLGEPFLAVRSRMAAGLYYDGLSRLTALMNSRDSPANNVFETKVMLPSPPSAALSSLTSSPFLSSDELLTPPMSLVTPSESFNEKPMFMEFWNESKVVENTFIPEPTKFNLNWLADSFMTGDGGVAPGDLTSYVAPGLLMVQ